MLRCYTFDKQKDGQNVREKVHIKFNLESAHKFYNYCNAVWRTASLRANYMEIAEYYKKTHLHKQYINPLEALRIICCLIMSVTWQKTEVEPEGVT